MIKVICITNTTSSGEHLYLTKGKIYDTYEGTYEVNSLVSARELTGGISAIR